MSQSTYRDVKKIFNDLAIDIDNPDKMSKYITKDEYLTKEFKDRVKETVKQAFEKIGTVRYTLDYTSGTAPVGVNLTELDKDAQLKLIDSYLDSILKDIKYKSDNWNKLRNTIVVTCHDVNDSERSNPATALNFEENQWYNILRNVSNYILNYHNNKNPVLLDKSPKKQVPNTFVARVRQIRTEQEKEELNKLRKEKEQDQAQQQENEQKMKELKTTANEQGEKISTGQQVLNQYISENKKLREDNKKQEELIEKLKIPRRELNEVKDDIHKLSKKNQIDILNGVALTYATDPKLKQHIGDVRKALKADPEIKYDDNQINYIITKALSENDRYLKTVAANPDLFDRDMSQDTIQKENEQFQSKLRQQNLRYILPKFIERREKLVENTLNPELLKGAFAI